MPTVAAIAAFLEHIAPLRLAEEWDNVGLLVGDPQRQVGKVMTCLTVTPQSAAEAIEAGPGLIVTHHPLPFAATKRLTTDTTSGQLLLDLIAARIAVYSAHTAYDSAATGINQCIAEGIGLHGIAPLIPHPDGEGTGRWGWLPDTITLSDLARLAKKFLSIDRTEIVGEPTKPIRTVAVACGAADELLDAARANECDAMLIGEARFHTCLAAEAAGIGLVLPGHFASERFAMERLAEALAGQFPDLAVWASTREEDPLRVVD